MLHRNLPLKAAAAGLAIFLWFWVSISERGIPQPGSAFTSGQTVTSRIVPVVVTAKGKLPEGVRVNSIRATPAVAIISGLATRVRGVRDVETTPLDLAKVRAESFQELQLVTPPGVKLEGNRTVLVSMSITWTGTALSPPRPGGAIGRRPVR